MTPPSMTPGGSLLSFNLDDGSDAALDAGSKSQETSILDTVILLVTKRFVNQVLVPFAKIDGARPLAKIGMDSMLVPEFRTWFYHAFKVDVPFLELLDAAITIGSLGEMIEKVVVEARGG